MPRRERVPGLRHNSGAQQRLAEEFLASAALEHLAVFAACRGARGGDHVVVVAFSRIRTSCIVSSMASSPGFEVRDPDFGIEITSFAAQPAHRREHRRAKVLGCATSATWPFAACRAPCSKRPSSTIRTGAPCSKRFGADAVDDVPQLVVRPGVARKYQAARTAIEVVTDRGHGMYRRQRGERARADAHAAPEFDFAVSHERRVGRGNLGEIRPDRPVEQVIPEDLDGRRRRVHRERAPRACRPPYRPETGLT